jgi:hypothetical protein
MIKEQGFYNACVICFLIFAFGLFGGCKPIEIGEPLDITEDSKAIRKSGELTEDEIWTGTIIVEDDVIVPKNDTLTIDRGSKIKFTKNASLIIDGTLFAEGQPNKAITLTSNEAEPKAGDWGGIIFSESSLNSKVQYCVFQFHTQLICSSDSLNMNNCIIAEGSVAGIVFEVAAPTFEDNMVTKNGTGIICDKSASPTIAHNAITANLVDGIECKGSSFPKILYNVINTNRKNGIYCHSGASPEISYNNISYNGSWAVFGGGKLKSNFIKGNKEQGMEAIDTRETLSGIQYQGAESVGTPRSSPITEAGIRKEERW